MARKKIAIAPPAPVDGDPLFTPDEAAKYLRMSRHSLRRFTAAGRVTFHRYSSQILRYSKSALDQFLVDVKVEAA